MCVPFTSFLPGNQGVCFALIIGESEERPLEGGGEEEEAEGFGKMYPSVQPSLQQEEGSDDEHSLSSGVVSRKELEKGRLSRDGKVIHSQPKSMNGKETNKRSGRGQGYSFFTKEKSGLTTG